jgi:anthranilate/para-aminobenzoate synthase component II
MGIAHREFPVFGVQFHPESILTEAGHDLVGNFVAMASG